MQGLQYISAGLFKINSKTTKDTVYSLTVSQPNKKVNEFIISCDCLGYLHREKCWHTDLLHNLLGDTDKCMICYMPILTHLDEHQEKYDQFNNHVISASLPHNNHNVKNELYHEQCLIKEGYEL